MSRAICIGKTYTSASRKVYKRVREIDRGWVHYDVVQGVDVRGPHGSVQLKYFKTWASLLVPTVCVCGHRADVHEGVQCAICDCATFKERART